ncbi:peptidase domain-containing ABC transporter [Flexivirga lutea]
MGRLRPELQLTPTECGLCCAAMVLHSRGCRDSTVFLRAELDLGRDGASIGQLRSLLEARGLSTKLYKANTEGLRKVGGQVIAHWENSHFVVVEKIGRRRARIVDPAVGRRSVDLERFEESFSGVAMEILPGSAETVSPDRRGRAGEPRHETERPFVDAVKHSRGLLLQVVLISLAIYAVDLALPYATKRLVDQAVGNAAGSVLKSWIPLLLAGGAGLILIGMLRSELVARVSTRIGAESSERIMAHMLRLPFKYFDTRQPGELAYRLSGVAAIRDMLAGQLWNGVFQAGGLAAYLGYMFYTNVQLGLLSCVLVGIAFGVLFGSRGPIYNVIQNEILQTGKAQTLQVEAVQSILALKAAGGEGYVYDRWRTENNGALSYLRKRTRMQGAANAFIGMLQLAGPLTVLLGGLWLWKRGDISIGDAIAGQGVAIALFSSATAIYSSVTQYMTCRSLARRIRDIVESPVEERGTVTRRPRAEIAVRRATFRYTRTAPATLRGIDLDVPRHQTVAIVGPTGSGKSTLAKLLLGVYSLDEGEISVGGVPVTELAPHTRASLIGFVPQEVLLETASIADNIGFGADVSRAQIVEAAKHACIHDDIEKLPMGYETLLTNMGSNVSGGQRQRIGIARALVRRPEILVLDEATSSLDSATESKIVANLHELKCTMVVVAHRLASVVRADRIYVLEDGVVRLHGQHHELIARPGIYREMFAAQSGGFHDEQYAV